MKSESLQKKAVANSSTFKKVVIRICIILMVGSTLWVYIVYMFAPKQDNAAENVNLESEIVEILPENIDSENPDDSQAPIVISQDEELDEMDQTLEVQLENWEKETITLWDLSDSLQIN